ncbi:UPF0104 family protein, partial [bacterium]|nr:UPF0104 family protein [bacterium]
LFIASLAVRGGRWWWVLRRIRPGLPMSAAVPQLYVGYITNTILPGKVGEIAKLVLTTKRAGVSAGEATAAIAIDRIFDGLALGILAVGAALWAKSPLWIMAACGIGFGMFIAFYGIAVTLAGWPRSRNWILAVAARMKLESVTRLVTDGVSVLPLAGRPQIIGAMLVLSLANWILEGSLYWAIFHAIHHGVPFAVALAIMGIANFGGVILSSPAGVGSYEFLTISAATALGVPAPQAGAFALMCHLFLVVIPSLGGALGIYVIGKETVKQAITDKTFPNLFP